MSPRDSRQLTSRVGIGLMKVWSSDFSATPIPPMCCRVWLSRTLGDRRESDRGSASQTRCGVCQTVATYLESTSAGRGPKYLDSFGPSSPKVRESQALGLAYWLLVRPA